MCVCLSIDAYRPQQNFDLQSEVFYCISTVRIPPRRDTPHDTPREIVLWWVVAQQAAAHGGRSTQHSTKLPPPGVETDETFADANASPKIHRVHGVHPLQLPSAPFKWYIEATESAHYHHFS